MSQSENITATSILESYCKDTWNLHFNEMLFVGIRGALIKGEKFHHNENKINEWNDNITVFDKPNGFVHHFEGTVDAGLPFSQNPINAKGTARIEPGIHFMKLGLHQGREAFVQHSRVTVRRDSNNDLQWDEKDIVESGFFGIHLHAAHDIKTVGRDSAGCVVPKLLWRDPLWSKEFLERAKASKQTRFPLAIVDSKDLARWMGRTRF